MNRMKKISIGLAFLSVIVMCVMMTGMLILVKAVPTDATVKSYEQQLSEIAAKQQDALNRLADVRGDMSNVQATKQLYDEVVDLSIKKKNLTMQQLDTITLQIANKETAIAEAESNIARQKEAFMNRMVTMYEEGEASYIGLILGADDMVEFLSRIDMVTTILEYDKRVIASLEENTVQLAKNVEDLEYALQLQEAAIDDLEDNILDARAMADEALAYMESLQQNESALLQDYYNAKAQEEELNKKLEERLRQLQEQEKSNYVGGDMDWPLPYDVSYQVSSEFGWRTLWGAQDYHLGIDLACAANTPVYAANAGKVIESAYHYSYGNYVLIDHGGGKATLYAHMNERWVSAGDKVTQRQQIGLVGTTGSSSGNHLHFEVLQNLHFLLVFGFSDFRVFSKNHFNFHDEKKQKQTHS